MSIVNIMLFGGYTPPKEVKRHKHVVMEAKAMQRPSANMDTKRENIAKTLQLVRSGKTSVGMMMDESGMSKSSLQTYLSILIASGDIKCEVSREKRLNYKYYATH